MFPLILYAPAMTADATPAKNTKPTAGLDPDAGWVRVYKPGQGKWTRIGTGIGAALIIALTVFWFLRDQLVAYTGFGDNPAVLYGILLGSAFALGVLAWWLINRPKHAQFLIETDGEMKKVNWTSRAEIVGSTKVVIVFMFLIAAVLFLFDLLFGTLFWGMGILEAAPLFGGGEAEAATGAAVSN